MSADIFPLVVMKEIELNFSNIHCEDCRDSIYTTISRYFPLTEVSDVSLIAESQNTTVLFYLNNNVLKLFFNKLSSAGVNGYLVKKLIKELKKTGFIVISWELRDDENAGEQKDNNSHTELHDIDSGGTEDEIWFSKLISSFKKRQINKNHLKHCKKCQDEKESSDSISEDSTLETLVDRLEKEFRAVFTIEGMTCASCAQSISEAISQVLSSAGVQAKVDEEPLFSVNLLQNNAIVLLPNKKIVNKVVDLINDMGFDCRLLELLPVQRSVNLKVTAIIGGVTCASCVNSIVSAVNELPFILECGINAVTKVGQFIIENTPKDDDNLTKLRRTIEDCGFDFDLVSKTKINYTLNKKRARSIHLRVEGMFCNHCPEIITQYLESYGEAVVIEDPLTLKYPYIRFKYLPSQDVNIRNIMFGLNHLQRTKDGYQIDVNKKSLFECNLIEPESMDEHIRKLSKKEFIKIAWRLVIATVFAIPTFIFGVVAMTLLHSTNPFRVWVEEPIWAGNVARNTWILLILSTPVYFFAADIFHRKAFKEVSSLWMHRNSFKRRIFKFGSMSLLMSAGTSVSYFASIALLILSANEEKSMSGLRTTYFDSVVFLSFFLLIGRLLESYSKRKTADSISNLSSMKVTNATLVEEREGKFVNDQIIDVKYLESDDYIRVLSGDSPPVDCILVDGSTEFDESALTGESTPVKHSPGHQIFSGTVNIGNSAVVAKIINIEDGSLIDQIIDTVRNGQLRKAPIEKVADQLTGYFVPIIVTLAIVTWIIWLALAYSGRLPDSYLDIDVGGWTVWSLEFAIAVFVIACPCGIGLAAPTALLVGSGLAAKYGILAKGGGAAFQQGANISTICFDKTGTLTNGKLLVTDFAFVEDKAVDRSRLIKLFGIQATRDLELASKHPIAEAAKLFINEYTSKHTEFKPTQNRVPQVETVPGKGLKGRFLFESDNDAWSQYSPSVALLGNEALMKDHGVTISSKQNEVLTNWKEKCKSVILVAIKAEKFFDDGKFHLLLMMACRDLIRAESKKVISYIQKNFNIQCWMITGDNKLTADAIASEINIRNVVAEVLPEEKELQIKRVQKVSGGVVAMVGDGINDAPALATADVGIALSSGTDIAITSSDFVLLNRAHPLLALLTLLDLSKVCFNRVKFNFAWSLIYNIIGIPIAAGVIYPYHNSRLNPVWASAAMAASSISVVMSSLALKLYRPKLVTKELDFESGEEHTYAIESKIS
ncbi:uncharacterized protein PRCAT00000117001 [Priceomyces carsonii]|uniref:uncharacterized protein n=1 Tax=Priceomyces carsonii TaxID=28549 RepID=UPI002ED996C0|nr:unnamed protein product [Priceomyces carsonii]